MNKFKRLHKLSILPVTYKFAKNHFVTIYLMELSAHEIVLNFEFYEKKATRTVCYGEEYIDYMISESHALDILDEYMDTSQAIELIEYLNWQK
jgi:hypothetical protein